MTFANSAKIAAVVAAATLSLTAQSARPQPRRFTVVESSIRELAAAMQERRVTSHQIVAEYLSRIGTYEDRLHAALTVNPRALEEAEERDRERAAGRIRGPLHGIPIAIKDNIQTTDMPTTGGALAFEGFVPPYEATVRQKLRDAGAVIIAKTGMTELANWVAGPPTPMPGNYNAIGGFGMNPYDPRKDPRAETYDGRPALTPGGSSSAIGTAVNLWPANVGTETSGSILNPANQLMLVGIKPTVGRVSRYGVIPITADQDTPGPIARTVSDAAILLGALERGNPDPHDPATSRCTSPAANDYTRFLNIRGLRNARIGIPRAQYYAERSIFNANGLTPEQRSVMADAISVLKREGAVVIDPADIPSAVDRDPERNIVQWNTCSGTSQGKGQDERCSVVFKYGMKRDFNNWLSSLGASAPVKSLTELREWNLAHKESGAIKYGQSNLDISDEMDLVADKARYEADRKKDVMLAGEHGIDEILKSEHLDALLFPGSNGASLAAKPGYPTVIVPFGFVPNAPSPPFPAGFDAKPQPFGVSFTATACSEPRLIEIAYAFEQATKRRVAPAGFP